MQATPNGAPDGERSALRIRVTPIEDEGMMAGGTKAKLRRLSLVTVLAVGLACAAAAPRGIAPNAVMGPVESPADRVEAEQYAVLSAAISSKYVGQGAELVVIEDQTTIGTSYLVEQVHRRLPEVPAEVISDFEVKNQEPRRPRLLLDLSVPYLLLPASEAHPNGGRAARRSVDQEPHPRVTVRLTIPGLSSDMDRALVYIRGFPAFYSDAGYLLFMVKEAGVWKIKGEAHLYTF
jgi:hypothetical protein